MAIFKIKTSPVLLELEDTNVDLYIVIEEALRSYKTDVEFMYKGHKIIVLSSDITIEQVVTRHINKLSDSLSKNQKDLADNYKNQFTKRSPEPLKPGWPWVSPFIDQTKQFPWGPSTTYPNI